MKSSVRRSAVFEYKPASAHAARQMHTINAHLLVGRGALDLRNKKSSEDAHECVREETMGDIDPTEVISVRKGEKERDFRHRKQYIDATRLLPGPNTVGKSNTSSRARAHGVVRRVAGLPPDSKGVLLPVD